MKTIEDLLASLAMTNNGYLFAPSAAEMAVAIQHQDVVSIRNGQIHRIGVQPCHPSQPTKIDWNRLEPQPDYEGMILSRQAAYLFD